MSSVNWASFTPFSPIWVSIISLSCPIALDTTSRTILNRTVKAEGGRRGWNVWSEYYGNTHYHPLEKDMATHPSALALRIPWTEEPGRLQSMRSQRVGTTERLTLLLLSCFSRVQLCATPWTAAYQALPSMGFSRQEYWSGVPLPSLMYIIICKIDSHWEFAVWLGTQTTCAL